jgi:hypothetical protein
MYVSSDIIAYFTPRELLIMSAQIKYYRIGVIFTVTVVLLRTGRFNIKKIRLLIISKLRHLVQSDATVSSLRHT